MQVSQQLLLVSNASHKGAVRAIRLAARGGEVQVALVRCAAARRVALRARCFGDGHGGGEDSACCRQLARIALQ